MSLPAMECIYVTEDFIREWKSGNPSFKPPNSVPMLRFLYELSWSMVRGELPIQKYKAALDSFEFSDKASNEEISSTFADAVTHMALDLTMPGENRARLIKLAKWLVESTIVPLRLFQERCEEEFLWEAEMIKIKAADLKSKEVRVNTRSLYQQTKFNLLREESEGYAKLVTLLCRGSEASIQRASTATVGIIKSLIGHFDLDPNRVFDIVLECFELQPDNDILLDLIPIFPKSHASQILGFKFQYYQRMEVDHSVPFRLYQLTALLVKEEYIDLDSIYAHLLPKDEDAFEIYNVFSAKRFDEANKIGKINLAARGKDLMDDEKQGDVTTDLFSALYAESEAVTERVSELENSQTLGLLTGLLTVDDWCHAKILFDRLSSLNPSEHIQISKELFRLIERSISSAYELFRKTQFQNSLEANSNPMDTESPVGRSFIDLPKEIFEMVSCAGPYLYRDTLLLQKVCKVLKGYLLSAVELVNAGDGASNFEAHSIGNQNPRLHLKEARSQIEEALGTSLLPSLQLIPANPAIGQEIWEVMSLLPYEVRYRLYGEWEKDDERMPMVLVARQIARLDTRRILKRLAKENLKQLGRMVAKLAHANPMTVLRTIVHQIEAYKDMITPVVDAFKYLTQLEYDILEYVVIERLAQGGREKLKEDGLNLSDWLQSLASFWGHLCKKYPSMELRGLFQYLVNQLKKGRGTELVLLQELVQQMANMQYTENLTEEQLDSMAGSDMLRYQATSFGITRNNKALVKSTNRLRDALLPKEEPKLAVPLLLLVAQHRSLIVANADDAPYIKMVSEQFDRCHGTLLQYVDFLCSAVKPTTAYAQLIPSLDDLFHLYHLDPEVAFLIYRHIMRLFKSQSGSDVFWPVDDSESLRPSSADTDSGPTDSCDELILDLSPSRKPIKWSDLLNTVRSMLPSKAWNSLSPDLYVTFWGLTLYDLYVPRSRYESEIAKQNSALRSLEELSDNSSSAIMKRKKEKERIQESLDRLTNELHKHEEHVASVHKRLSREKDKWLSSCPDSLKINTEFLQRCIFPRCTFSMPDAVYCAMFVHTLHSLGTPFFNTVNHIDVLICKTLQPMICCCTEYEVGRLGRFLYETLKMAYFWKSKESIYERDCGNMPGFAVYYRLPNSQRVTYGQFVKVHWKWSQRITRLLIQCLESMEYMEIRNALILLTKISGVFPVTRKSGINLEKRVAKIKSDEREDLKVLATGVAAALASRKPSWVSDEEFGMGFFEVKPSPSVAPKILTGNQQFDNGNGFKDQILRRKPERMESASLKSDSGQAKVKANTNGSTSQASLLAGTTKLTENQKHVDELSGRPLEENVTRVDARGSTEIEVKVPGKRPVPTGSLSKQSKQDIGKDDNKSGKAVGKTHPFSDKDITHPATVSSVSSANGNAISATAKSLAKNSDLHESDLKSSDFKVPSVKDDGAEVSDIQRLTYSRSVPSPRHNDNSVAASRSVGDKQQKRVSPAVDLDRVTKRRKGETESRDLEGEVRFSERERSVNKNHQADLDKSALDDQNIHKSKDNKGSDWHDRDYKERTDIISERPRDKSIERYARDRSIERGEDRDRPSEKIREERGRDDRSKFRLNEISIEKSQHLPPPPPLPPHVLPQSMSAARREEDSDRRYEVGRHPQRLSPRHDERERRRSEENNFVLADDAKRRREEDLRDRKREEREAILLKMEEREREKASLLKEEMDANAASKRRKLKREYIPEPGEYSPGGPALPPLGMPQSYNDRAERKGATVHRPSYFEEIGLRAHGNEAAASKMARRDTEQMYDRDWEEEKPHRAEQKRRHRK